MPLLKLPPPSRIRPHHRLPDWDILTHARDIPGMIPFQLLQPLIRKLSTRCERYRNALVSSSLVLLKPQLGWCSPIVAHVLRMQHGSRSEDPPKSRLSLTRCTLRLILTALHM